MTILSPLLTLFYSTANDGQTWTFDYFMQQVMISNCTLFFPIIITLIAGYIITREYTDDTMKNISTIPILSLIHISRHRKKNVSFIFQSYNLIDYLTPVENVALTSKLPPLPILERLRCV